MYDEAIKLDEGVFWVGDFQPDLGLQCNAYLLVEGDHAVIIDPGAPDVFPRMMRKVLDVVRPTSVKAVIVAHQDPDVVGALPIIERVCTHPQLKVVAHLNTARLLHHLGLKAEIVACETLGDRYHLDEVRVLQFIPSLFLHSPGAVATYDPATGTLFTGDVFGFASAPEDWDLFEPNGFPEHLDAWHQTYMASRRALHPFLDIVEKLAPTRVCPQHGAVLQGERLTQAIARLRTLDCGMDLIYGPTS